MPGIYSLIIIFHRYACPFCGKDSVKRSAVGIWKCDRCYKTIAGGAWTLSYFFIIFIVFSTPAAFTIRSSIQRLRRTVKGEKSD